MKGLAANALSRLKRRDLLENRAFVAGEWLSHGNTLSITDPATAEHLIDVAACPVETVDRRLQPREVVVDERIDDVHVALHAGTT